MILSRRNYCIKIIIFLQRRLSHSSTQITYMRNLLAPAYKPAEVEKNKYEKWEKSRIFSPIKDSEKETYCMVLPPPNITGKLHLGHALTCTIQDVILRRKRALGYNVLWIPGIDHAGIATQGVVEKYLKSTRNIDRRNLSREKFHLEVWKWVEKYGSTIGDQLRTLGCSLDWTREMFTMSPAHSHAVNTAFINLFDKGLIYRSKQLVNWCSTLKSTISDIEVDEREVNEPTDITVPGHDKPIKFGVMYDVMYEILGSKEGIVVSTTMPETIPGDVAIAVHPDDIRYKHLQHQVAIHPFSKKPLPIIFDKFVNMHIGSGAVKITPAHSKVDYEIAKTHRLPILQVTNEDGLMYDAGPFNGSTRFQCREKIIGDLLHLGLLKKITPHKMTLPVCSRSGDIIFYLPKEQWFIACSDMNRKASEAVTCGDLEIKPEKYIKSWMTWTNDNRDWCISRQLWWGHQVPAYKCSSDENSVWVAAADEEEAIIKASKHLKVRSIKIQAERDTDVLDTWFSSGLYPFAALGWPQKMSKEDFKFYPLSLMATGHDILGFWVHRMVILGRSLTGTLPFKNVLLHGVICDHKGGKMSKSKGNVIDPIDVIKGITLDKLAEKSIEMHKNGTLSKDELKKALSYQKSHFFNTNGIPECGVDALRFTLLSSNIKSNFINFDIDICHSNKLFCNKIWQSVKYTILAFAKLKNSEEEINISDLTLFDKWILSRLAVLVENVGQYIDSYDFHKATKSLRSIMYNDFCDVYLEATKPGFHDANMKIAYAHAHTLSAFLNTSLRCLNPFMIYLTDELIPRVPGFRVNIIQNFNDFLNEQYAFPQYQDFEIWQNKDLEAQVDKMLDAVSLVRGLKGTYGISKQRPTIRVLSSDETLLNDLREHTPFFLNLTRCCSIKFDDGKHSNYVKGYLDKDTEIGIELLGDEMFQSVDKNKERLQNKVKKLKEGLLKMEEKFASDHYNNEVPEWTKIQDQEKLLTKKKELQQLERLIGK